MVFGRLTIKSIKNNRKSYFRKNDECKALEWFEDVVTPQASLSGEKGTFFSSKALNLLEQVIILLADQYA